MRSVLRSPVVLAALFCLAGAWLILHGLSRPRHPNVILIVVDTLRADHLGVYGYSRRTSPAIDEFARENLMFTRAISVAPWTAPSVASMFTGFYPRVHGVIKHAEKSDGSYLACALGEDFETLAEIFKKNGYRTIGISANRWVADYLGFAQGFDVFKTFDHASGSIVTEQTVGELEGMQKWGKPFFLYVHYMDPHQGGYGKPSYTLPTGFDKLFVNDPPPPGITGSALWHVNQYDAAIRFLDTQIRRLMSELKARHLYDDTAIVFTADHGEQMGENGRFGHGYTLYREEVHVPMIVKARLFNGRRDDIVSNFDVYSTLLERRH